MSLMVTFLFQCKFHTQVDRICHHYYNYYIILNLLLNLENNKHRKKAIFFERKPADMNVKLKQPTNETKLVGVSQAAVPF